MIIVVKPGASDSQVHEIIDVLERNELKAHVSEGAERLIIGVIGDKSRLTPGSLEVLTGVEKIVPIMESYKLASRQFRPEGTSFNVKDVTIGGKELVMMAGPCAVESEEKPLPQRWLPAALRCFVAAHISREHLRMHSRDWKRKA